MKKIFLVLLLGISLLSSFYLISAKLCYQESANTSNQTGVDGNCGLNYSGNYSYSTSANWVGSVTNTYDGDFATSSSFGEPGAFLVVNYSKPSITFPNGTWQYKTLIGGVSPPNTINYTLSSSNSCFTYNNNWSAFRFRETTFDNGSNIFGFSIECYNGTWDTVLKNGFFDSVNNGFQIYEDAMWWGIDTAPTTALNSPADVFNSTTQSNTFQCTPTDAEVSTGLNVTLYGNWSGSWAINQSNISSFNNTATSFTVGSADGSYIWNCLTTDSGGLTAFATSNRTINVDTSGPGITPVGYTNGTVKKSTQQLTLNISIIDTIFGVGSNCFVNVNGTNQSISLSGNLADTQRWCNSSVINLTGTNQGNNTIKIYASNFLGDYGLNSQYSVDIDDNAPTIKLPVYTNGTIKKNTDTLTLNISATDSHIGSNVCFIDINGTNQTIAISSSWCNITNGNLTNLADGNRTIKVYVNDTLGNLGLNNSYVVDIDTTNPSASLYSPANNTNSSSSSNTYIANISDNLGILNVSVRLNGTINQTNTSGFNNTAYTFTITQQDSTHAWDYEVYDLAGNKNTTAMRWRLVDTTAPVITIIHPKPQNYNDNNSIALDFTSIDAGVGTISACIYNVVNQSSGNTIIANTSLTNCGNTTFGVTAGDIDYNLTLYSNDTLGNMALKYVVFGIRTTKPAVSLDYPTNNYFSNTTQNINFNFTATDTNGISTCQFDSNFTGTWAINQTFTSVTSGVQVNTKKNLTNNGYIWNARCNNSNGNFDQGLNNFTVTIDTIIPSLSLDVITPTTGSQTFTFNTTSADTNLNSCFYSIYDLSNVIDGLNSNVTFTCNNLTSATTTAYGTFNLVVYANDSAGNLNSKNSLFTLSATVPQSTGGGGAIVENQIPVIALIKSPNSIMTYLNLSRAILYVRINEVCSSRIGSCSLTQDQQTSLIANLSKQRVVLNQAELILWLDQYNNGNIENVYLDLKDVQDYKLVAAKVSISPTAFQVISPTTLDFLSFSSYREQEITLNKLVSNCTVLIGSDVGFSCDPKQTYALMKFQIPANADYTFKVFKAIFSFTSNNGEQTTKEITFRSIRFTFPLVGGIVGISGVGILGYSRRKQLQKVWKKMF